MRNSNKRLRVCNRCNEEIYFHVLRGWLHWDMAQRKAVSAPKLHSCPTRADDMSLTYKCEVVCCSSLN